mgnify:CR=1 FL=1
MKNLCLILLLITILLMLYLFLIAPRIWRKPDRTPLLNVLYAHRGLFDNKTDAPENSLPAFQKAVEAGYGIELDVQLSKDGIPVVFHDASLKRMCGVNGNVWDYPLSELKQLKLADSNATIPTFAEVLDVVGGKVPLIIEYKLDVPQTKVCRLVNDLLGSYTSAYCIECFHPFALLWYRTHRPDVVRGQLCMEYWKEDKYRGNPFFFVLSYLVTNAATRPDFVAYKHSDASNLSFRLTKRMGALAVAWTIKSQTQLEEAKKHFDLFIFDSFIPKKESPV